MAQMTMVQAINDALKSELKRDEDVLVFGEDVGVNGGVFRVTEGLQKEFGEDRVFDTPLAESGIGGLALGLAVTGYRPVMEIQFLDSYLKYLTKLQVKLLVHVSVQAGLNQHQLLFVHHLVVEYTPRITRR